MHEAGMRMRWRMKDDVDDAMVLAFAAELNVPPIVARLLLQRGLDDVESARAFLDPKLTDLHDPADLPGCDCAARRIVRAIRDEQPVVIYGDYDVDGITASAILWHTLRTAGANVACYVPHRIDEGYGLNTEAITQIADNCRREHSQPPLIITVDCGITATDQAAAAKMLGIDLIITDHHEFDADDLPDAFALVHPGIDRDSNAPLPVLCGAGVAFKLAWQTAKTFCGSERLPEAFKRLMIDLLSLAALGTIADVVPLRGENRVIVKHGLGRIKHTSFAGLNALIDAARLRDETIDSYHVGFVLGPRLNACGRMGHAKDAVHLLTNATADEARELASFLTKENDRRRATERKIFEEAKHIAIENGYDCNTKRAMVIGNIDWHPGVLGIVASRMVEAFCRPVVMLNFDNGEAKGSARSVDGVSIHAALCECESLLTKFGGHAMAAGLTLETDRVGELREALIESVNAKLAADDLVNAISVDAECTIADVSIPAFEKLFALAPFGRDNPSPRFCLRQVTLDEQAMRIGSKKDHLRLWLREGRTRVQAVAFGLGDLADDLPRGVAVDVIFEPKISTWQGRRRAEMHVKDIRLAGVAAPEPAAH